MNKQFILILMASIVLYSGQKKETKVERPHRHFLIAYEVWPQLAMWWRYYFSFYQITSKFVLEQSVESEDKQLLKTS